MRFISMRPRLLLAASFVAATAASPGLHGAEATAATAATDNPPRATPYRVRRNFETTLTIYRNGEPEQVSITLQRMTLGGRLERFDGLAVGSGPVLLQLRAGEVRVISGETERELNEGEFFVHPGGQPLVLTTEDDTATIQYVATERN